MLTSEAKSELAKIIRGFRGTKANPNDGILLRGLREQARSLYRLDIEQAEKAGLPEDLRCRRDRLETWLNEQARAELASKKPKDKQKALKESRERHFAEAIQLAGATLLNRLVAIMQLEARGMRKPAVLTGGWDSSGYREFRDFAPDLCKDGSEGYDFLLSLVYDELALELPGLFGRVGLTDLFPVPVSVLRQVVDALNEKVLAGAWLDDTTLGWVYQYWNDPAREALDTKLSGGGKVEPHEIASKTQMFTERYMVEWLLQNSLNQQWLAICERNGWEAQVKQDGTLAALAERRAQWREKRENGEVALDALMPIESEQEQRWKYWVPQPGLESEAALESIREIKIFDPACGSGHFLVIAVDLLFSFYGEEATHRGEVWETREIVESILENNLFGLDLDPRAVQIAAASLYLKGRSLCPQASPSRLNLVASNLNLAAFETDDPAREALRVAVQAETGIPGSLTDEIVEALKGADVWGSLLQVDWAVDEAIAQFEQSSQELVQESLLGEKATVVAQPGGKFVGGRQTRRVLLEKLERFLEKRTRRDDLGLRLKGEQLAAGVRFVNMVREGAYDLVVGNPPYQGTSKMRDSGYVKAHYKEAKADLYAAFLVRGLQLVKRGGLSALLTMRNWMFISQYSKVRESLIDDYDLRALGDFDRGAFDEVPNEVLSVVISIFKRTLPEKKNSVALQPTPFDDTSYDRERTNRKRAAVLAQVGRFEFKTNRFDVIKEKPLIYWWDEAFLKRYAETPKMEDETEVRQGMATGENIRFLRKPWEVNTNDVFVRKFYSTLSELQNYKWVPYIKGAMGRAWFEPISELLLWESNALGIKLLERNGKQASRPQNEAYYFTEGIAFTSTGNEFKARCHRFQSVFDVKGQSVFPKDNIATVVLMNSRIARNILAALNPSISFQVGDARRLPLFPIQSADRIFAQLETAFTLHESAREPSVEFQQPAPTCWPYAQDWAQRAVDRPEDAPLPSWEPTYQDPAPTDWISYGVGLALGRFPLNSPVTSPNTTEPTHPQQPKETLDRGILYLSTYAKDTPNSPDSLNHPACDPLKTYWQTHSPSLQTKSKTKDDLHNWLRHRFFPTVHLPMYENRPIYFPLSSTHKNFVAYLSIHRFNTGTINNLLVLLSQDLRTLQGELADLLEAAVQSTTTNNNDSQNNRQSHLQSLRTELQAFIDLIRQCTEIGPSPANPKDPTPETTAPYQMNLDDGVMINSAALWPLLDPQWNKGKQTPKQWWHELTTAKGRKDYDWSHLAARYFPNRVDAKCQKDPSLAVAHGCFWRYHPAKAYEWELRLQDEIGPDFTIDEADSDRLRAEFEAAHPEDVQELKAKEEKRRERKRKKEEKAQLAIDGM